MKKLILKMFMPSSGRLAQMMVEGLQRALDESGKKEAIAKYASSVQAWSALSEKIADWLKDGTIDESEKNEIVQKLSPLVQKAVDLL